MIVLKTRNWSIACERIIIEGNSGAAPESQGRRFDSCQGPKVAFFAAVPGYKVSMVI